MEAVDLVVVGAGKSIIYYHNLEIPLTEVTCERLEWALCH
jgi:hypothetical protein